MAYTQVYPLQITQSMSDSEAFIMVLSAPEHMMEVPVLIGEAEARAIILAVEQKQASRPLTHNLMNSILDEYMLSVTKVTIDRFNEGVFYSTLYVSDGLTEKKFDSRTSDAIVLSLLQKCDVFMDTAVLEETGMTPGALHANLPQNKQEASQEDTLETLEDILRECEENEDYEQAAEIQKRIDAIKIKGSNND